MNRFFAVLFAIGDLKLRSNRKFEEKKPPLKSDSTEGVEKGFF